MIIESLLDNDLYKFTMGQIALHKFASYNVRYKFKCRNKGIVFTREMVDKIVKEVEHFCTLRLTDDEENYLHRIGFLKPSYIEFMKLYKPNLAHFAAIRSPDTGELDIIIKGPWYQTIYWEVPVLAIVNEVYSEMTHPEKELDTNQFIMNLDTKIATAKDGCFKFSEFGTRRRYSKSIQDRVDFILSHNKSVCSGTSNVYFAMKHGMKPIGTMAHEFICAGQGSDDVTLANSQKYMLQKWVDEYRGDLGIALSDTLGIDKFLKDFDPYFMKLYDGVRHDSGDPVEWGKKMIRHYTDHKINPITKTLVFSDGLTFGKAAELQAVFGNQINVAFGIGTNLTNDFEGYAPLQIVIKMVECNGRPVAKLSDTPSKTMCEDRGFIDYLKSVI